MSNRLSRDIYFMQLAISTSLRGTCPRAVVGCVLVTPDNRIVATGYNSSFPKSPHCSEVGCLIENNHCVRCLHAEEAAILKLEHKYDQLIAYITHQPCIHCYKLLCNAGARSIYYLIGYGDISPQYHHLINEIGMAPYHTDYKRLKDYYHKSINDLRNVHYT